MEHFSWTGDTPKVYQSSEGVQRHFCGTCGAPMGFEADHYAGMMHVYAASLENPEAFNPTFHVNYESKLPWLKLDDDLAKHDMTLLHVPEDSRDST